MRESTVDIFCGTLHPFLVFRLWELGLDPTGLIVSCRLHLKIIGCMDNADIWCIHTKLLLPTHGFDRC